MTSDYAAAAYALHLQTIVKSIDKEILAAMKAKGTANQDRLEVVEALIRHKSELNFRVESVKHKLGHA